MNERSGCRARIVQFNALVGDISGNAERIIAELQTARAAGIDLLVFPELALCGYPPEDLLLRPEFMQRVDAALERLRAETQGIALVLGYPRAALGGLFNVAGVWRDGELVAEYAKQVLPNYSVFDEKRYFQPGATPVLFEHCGLRIALSVCEDIWHEEPARQAAEAGARVLVNLNASPFHSGKGAEREVLLQRRACDHGLSILYANLLGGQDELVFDGASFAVDAAGAVVARAPSFEEYPLDLEIDAGAVPSALHARDAERVQPEADASIYAALVLGVRDYVTKNGFSGAVLGLSGGIDSALTLAIAVDALGAERVEAVLMPSRYTAGMSIEDAEEQARRLGVLSRIIPIESAFHSFLELLDPVFEGAPPDVTEENVQARCRGVLLMAISNKRGHLLLTTGNKSEMAVGYATLYGDMAGGFAPIKDVPKLLVYRLARYRNTLGEAAVIPERVLTRAPSAELRPDQTDQDSLPPYEVLDVILRLYVEEDQGIAAIVAQGFEEEIVRRVARLVDRSEYKRRQAPPGVRISERAFGRDRRYPITSGF